jgi:PAS domain S-box-containing protein
MITILLVAVAVTAACAIAALLRAQSSSRDAAARWAITARVSDVLAEALDAEGAIPGVMRLLLPRFADWCVVHLVDDQHVRRLAVHRDPDVETRLVAWLDRRSFRMDAPEGPAEVLRHGEGRVFKFIPETLATDLSASERALLTEAGIGSGVTAPVKARQQTIGALTLARAATDAYDAADLEWVQDLAHRIGIALENARLFAEARELFEQTVSANFVSTPNGRILACNETFAALLGLDSVDEVRAAAATTFYARPEERERFVAELQQRRRLVGFESTIRRSDGRLVSVSENAVGTFNDRGELTKITGFLVDRTAEEDLEQQLRQAQRLEAVGQLAGGIAHDFNNLLTVIIGCGDLLRSERPDAAAGSGHDPLDELLKAAQRAATLTQQLLAFSRRQVLQPREVDLNDALRNVHSMLRRLVRENIVLMMDLDPSVDRIRVDPGQLDQVVLNLVVNSSDAMPAGGMVTVRTENVRLTQADVAQYPYVRPGAYVSLSVSDTGVGMDESTRAHVFEPFFTTKPVGKGTGLGLSTVYGIVKQSGGYVWVSSAPQAGTTVNVCLPAVATTEAGSSR